MESSNWAIESWDILSYFIRNLCEVHKAVKWKSSLWSQISPWRWPEGGRVDPLPLLGRDQMRDQGGWRRQELQFQIQFIWIPYFHELSIKQLKWIQNNYTKKTAWGWALGQLTFSSFWIDFSCFNHKIHLTSWFEEHGNPGKLEFSNEQNWIVSLSCDPPRGRRCRSHRCDHPACGGYPSCVLPVRILRAKIWLHSWPVRGYFANSVDIGYKKIG